MTDTETKQPVSILLVVYTPGGEVLLLKRCTPPVGAWQSITGSLQWGEQPLTAARRELREETGIQTSRVPRKSSMVNRFQIVPEALHLYADGVNENTEHVFFLQLATPCVVQLNHEEHDAYQWLPLAYAIRSVWSWSNRQALEALAEQFPTKIVD